MSAFDQIMKRYVKYCKDPYSERNHLKRELNYRFGIENVKEWLDTNYRKGINNEKD